MSFSTIFTIAIAAIILRALWLRLKASGTKTDSFKQLSPKDQLSVLKECLLNNPTERNLQNLKKFGKENGFSFDVETYRPFMNKQLEISKKKDALVEDNELFSEEARWFDEISPMEFAEAEEALKVGDKTTFIAKSLEGVARLYSDEAIRSNLEKLIPDYPKAETLLNDYNILVEQREQSGADDESLEKLRKLRNKWDEDLLDIQA